MTNTLADQIDDCQRKLAQAERELRGWEKNGARHNVEMGRVLVRTLTEQLRRLRTPAVED